MSSDLDTRARDEMPGRTAARQSSRRPSFILPILIAVGLVVYELTAQPGLGAAIACTKFGWDDFLTARWLRRRDSNRRRGRAEFWLYVAAGLWKTAVTAVVVMFAVAILMPFLPGAAPGNRPMAASFLAALWTAFIGFGLSTLATAYTFASALRHRTRLWIDSRVHRDRREDRWPPTSTPDRRNRAGAVLFTALFLGMLVALGLFYVVLSTALRGLAGPRLDGAHVAETLTNLFSCGAFLLIPVLILVFRDIIAQLALARTPEECWGSGMNETAQRHDPA